MSTVEVNMYTGNRCAYCNAAKKMLQNKGASFNEINVDENPEKREEMMSRTNRQSVPQIFIGDFHVGGFDDLAELNSEGKLDDLLNPKD